MAVLVILQLPLPVVVVVRDQTHMAVSVEVRLGRLLISRVLSPEAVVRLLEVLVVSALPELVLMVAILLGEPVALLVVPIQVLEQAVATSVEVAVVTPTAHTFKEQQAGLDILIPL
tara:strand:+ start:302 stop:649 length:348 start_codon:yes stop_codon:yes gene_type:complete